jgi:hypothetical protein
VIKTFVPTTSATQIPGATIQTRPMAPGADAVRGSLGIVRPSPSTAPPFASGIGAAETVNAFEAMCDVGAFEAQP